MSSVFDIDEDVAIRMACAKLNWVQEIISLLNNCETDVPKSISFNVAKY